ncbi:MAG: hypothetical protein CUN56_13315 [Phototrophicales bacterium]|nr:MAG: hypothetical protein CUN56_13315 [Phototrophicales bacterium]RMG76983.1 MAG: hypothetical protein D6711_02675 [Chloroflexota bacterium]
MKTRLFLIVSLFLLAIFVSAQEITPRGDEMVDPNANISWPPPVYVLRGEVDIRGSANLPNMSNYFLEFRPLEMPSLETPTPTSNVTATELPWFPISLPSSTPVVDDILGTWNTETTPDGLYEIRLTINVTGQSPIYFVVRPIRVENEPPDFVVVEEQSVTQPVIVTAAPPSRPTLAPTPTPVSNDPVVTANLDANVRSGDSTDFPVIGALRRGETADVIGISSSGSGWYYIILPNGSEGWISPTVVTASGNFRNVQRIAPPPPPFTPTPVPSPTPVTNANLTGNVPDLTPDNPTCNVPFQVLVNITNNGSGPTSGEATVLVQDVRVADNSIQSSFTRTLPVLNPGDNYVIGNNAWNISTYHSEQHRIVVIIDSGNAVPETNESDNILTTTYTLQQGTCP